MNNEKEIQAEILKRAIIATDAYLGMYKDALRTKIITQQQVHDFTVKLSIAMEALKHLKDLQNHNAYIESIISDMAKFLPYHGDSFFFDEPYTHIPASFPDGSVDEGLKDPEDNPCWNGYKPVGVKKKNGKTVPNCVPVKEEEELDIDDIIDDLEWDDISDTYEEEQLEEEILDEKISAASRLRKRMHFKRTTPKRQLGASIKLSRPSTMSQLQNRAKVAARRLLMKRFLYGRNKAQLSAQEKDSLEARIKAMKNIRTILAQRLIPKIRSLESKRLKSKR